VGRIEEEQGRDRGGTREGWGKGGDSGEMVGRNVGGMGEMGWMGDQEGMSGE